MAGKLRYWKERNGRYSARVVVPKHLRQYLPAPDTGKAELEIQLGPDRRAAIRAHPAATAEILRKIAIAQDRFDEITNKGTTKARRIMPHEQIALMEYLEQTSFDLTIREHDERYAAFGVDPDEARRYRSGYSGSLTNDELDELVGEKIRMARSAGMTDAQKGSTEWRRLAQLLCMALYESMARETERNEGVFDGKPSHPILVKALEALPRQEEHRYTFNDIIDEEVLRRSRGKNAKPLPETTVKKYRRQCESFARWRKDDNALTITAAETQRWVAAQQDEGDIENKTIKDRLQNLRTVISWARNQQPETFFPSGNPLVGLSSPDSKSTPSYLKAFTAEEAVLVLSAARKEQKPILRWIPWLCAYSGMRVSEAGALRKEDFFDQGPNWFWRVTTLGDRTLKNITSERRIPVHPALISEGLLDFVSQSPTGRLFRGDTKDEVNVQPRLSEWVRSLIPYDKRPNLSPNHGWRHVFEDLCISDQVADDAKHYITGRASGRSHEKYGKSDIMLPGLAAEMHKIKPWKV